PLLREKNITASFGIASFPLHGSIPQELIQVADASMYLSKHQGGNAVSTADHFDPNEARKWKRDVLEAYLGVTLQRLFATGPDTILNKAGPLNPDEWETMKSHVHFGARILEPLAPLARVRGMIRHHHEFFDGSGYPDAISGDKIPLGARILAIADAYDTITSD